MRYGIVSLLVSFSVRRLAQLQPDERTWRPNILALSGSPRTRWHLIEMANALARHNSALTVASVLPVEDWSAEKVQSTESAMREYLQKRNVEALVKIFPSPDMITGAEALVRAYGYGPLVPNTILLGETKKEDSFNDFARLIRLIYRTQRNLILLREAAQEVKEEADTIDVWWGGNQDNIGLMLTLAYLIKQSPVWRESQLVVKTIVAGEEERDAAQERLETFIEEQRLPAKAQVLVKEMPSFFDIIRQSSADASLVFMGMRPPEQDETIEEYSQYYGNLIEATGGMPSLALVLAAEKIEFRQVIGMTETA